MKLVVNDKGESELVELSAKDIAQAQERAEIDSSPEKRRERQRDDIKAQFTDTLQMKAMSGNPEAMATVGELAAQLEALE